MTVNKITAVFSAAPQLSASGVAQAAKDGFRGIIDYRPDNEEPGQITAAEMGELAAKEGLSFVHIPVVLGKICDADIKQMDDALSRIDGPVLGYCRTGARAVTLWALSQSGKAEPAVILAKAMNAGYDVSSIKARLKPASADGGTRKPQYDVVIVGGGSAGIATATSLLKRNAKLSIAVIEPATEHFYQPGWTMVGAGIFSPEQTRQAMADVMPDKVEWICQAATDFAPESNEVVLADGSSVSYRVLVAAPGLKLDWAGIAGLPEALGKNGVTSNYRYDLAPYTRDLVRELKAGRALFTQPQMPIKCAGAPQKAMYLSCDSWLAEGLIDEIDVEFHNAGAVLFGVATYVPALMKYVERYKIDLKLESKLVAVDGPRGVATFESKGSGGTILRTEHGFDMLHVVPAQVAPDFVSSSPLAGPAGFIDVDQATLRHLRFANVYALGDVCATTNAKTAAAVRKQAPVVAMNVLATLQGKEPVADYNGYGSCPLTVERGKIVLAEFGYGGKLLPSFPSWLIDGTKPSRAAWFLKARLLPIIYWRGMLKGREWMAAPHMIDKAVA